MKEKILKWLEALAINHKERLKLEEFADTDGSTIYAAIIPEVYIEIHGLENLCQAIGETPGKKLIDDDEYSHMISIDKYGVKFYELISDM